MKKWYLSKTLWVNSLALAAVIVQLVTGKALFDSETQVAILAGINGILRLVTKEELSA